MNGFMPIATRVGDGKLDLEQLCEKLDSGLMMVEVGSYSGESASIFLSSGKIKTMYCVDAWQGDYDGDDICSFTCPMQVVEKVFDGRMEKFLKAGIDVRKFKGDSVQSAEFFPDGSFDLVYVDACHTYNAVKADLLAWIPKVKENGWIAGHDFGCPMFPGVAQAVCEIIGKPKFTFCGGSWMMHKQNRAS